MIWAGILLHPAEFEEIDMKKVAKEFYKEFYGVDVTDEILDEIMAGKLSPSGE